MADYGGAYCGIYVVLLLFAFILSTVLKVASRHYQATNAVRHFTAHDMFSGFQIFLYALITMTGSILYQHVWPWSTWPSLICLCASVVVFRRIDAWNIRRRIATLMIIALLSGLTLVRLLDSSHPLPYCTIVCVLWSVAVPFMLIQLFGFLLTASICYYLVFVTHLSGCTILISSYVLSTIFGISGTPYQLLGIHLCCEFTYSVLRRYFIPRFDDDDEDKDEWLLRTLYAFIFFIDVSGIALVFL